MKIKDEKPDDVLGFKEHENDYLRRKRIERNKSFFTLKNTIRLIIMSVLLCGAFVIWAEQTGFEGESIFTTLLGFAIMFIGVIALALVGSVLFVVIRKLRGPKQSSFLDHEIHSPKDKDTVDKH